MRKCHRIIIALMIIGLLAGCGQEKQAAKPIPDTPENRAAEAKRYLDAVPPQEVMSDVGKSVSANAPEPQAAQFLKTFTENLDMKAIEKIMFEGLTKTFTADELRALADFFGSPVGKLAMSKYGNYMGTIMPAVQQEIGKAMQKGIAGMTGMPPQGVPGAPEAPSPAPATPEPPPKTEG